MQAGDHALDKSDIHQADQPFCYLLPLRKQYDFFAFWAETISVLPPGFNCACQSCGIAKVGGRERRWRGVALLFDLHCSSAARHQNKTEKTQAVARKGLRVNRRKGKMVVLLPQGQQSGCGFAEAGPIELVFELEHAIAHGRIDWPPIAK